MALLELADAKAHLRVDTNGLDDEIGALIASAERTIERQANIVATQRETAFNFDSFEAALVLPLAPIDAETVEISYLDAAGAPRQVAPEAFRVVTRNRVTRLVPAIGATWPTAAEADGAITVSALAGFATADAIPKNLIHAGRLLVQGWFEGNPDAIRLADGLIDLERLVIA